MREGEGGEKRKEGRFSPSALSVFRFHLSPFPPETPDTRANIQKESKQTKKRADFDKIEGCNNYLGFSCFLPWQQYPWYYELACASEASFNPLFRVLLEVGLVQFSHHKQLFQTINPFKNFASNSCHSFSFCDETKESRFHWLIYQGVMKEHNGTYRLVEYGSEKYIT